MEKVAVVYDCCCYNHRHYRRRQLLTSSSPHCLTASFVHRPIPHTTPVHHLHSLCSSPLLSPFAVVRLCSPSFATGRVPAVMDNLIVPCRRGVDRRLRRGVDRRLRRSPASRFSPEGKSIKRHTGRPSDDGDGDDGDGDSGSDGGYGGYRLPRSFACVHRAGQSLTRRKSNTTPSLLFCSRNVY